MKLIKNGPNIIATWPDVESCDSVMLTFGADSTCLYVPDGAVISVEESQIIDPRLSMTVDQVRSCQREDIDKKTDHLLAQGYTYPGTSICFRMDLEHQMSYKSVFDLRAYLTFPYTVKGVGDGYMTFQDAAEMTNFILYSFQWVGGLIQGGWVLKDALSSLTTVEELIAWADVRS